jgi:4-hydroxy-2-oxovalerate/4-hydroxy-2-oxohexanoate aldolase
MKNALISVLHVPGIGTLDELRMAADCGAKCVHVATHCTEADVSEQHIGLGRKLGLDTVGFLMMAHMTPVEALVEQALLMESYGAETVYCTDSAGFMLPEEVTQRIAAMRTALKPETEIGFHGHHNLGMGVANSIAAVAAGASRIDGSAAGFGAGAGNTPLEVFAAVSERMGIETGVDVFKLMDVAEDSVLPMMPKPPRADRDSLTLGYAGVYSTFLYPAKDCERKYGVPARDILVELGRQRMIGGQEDMIEDTALTMAKERGLLGHNSIATPGIAKLDA